MVEIEARYDPGIIILSFFISFVSAYCSICLCEVLRTTTDISKKYFLISAIAFVIGGLCIWSMHFVGMQALTLIDPNGHKMDMAFNSVTSILSLLAVLSCSFLGVFLASLDKMFSKSTKEIIDMFIVDASTYTMRDIKQFTAYRILYIISTKSLFNLVGGGILTGAGVCVMHYIGMAAFRFQGKIVWNPVLIFVSCVISVIAATAAYWILFRLLSIFPHLENLRIFSAFLMGIAVCGMHYTGMMAAKFEFLNDVPTYDLKDTKMESESSFIAVLATCNAILWIIAMIVLGDQRKSLAQKSRLLAQAEDTLCRIIEDTPYASLESSRNIARKYFSKKSILTPKMDPSSQTTYASNSRQRNFNQSVRSGLSRSSIAPNPHSNSNNSNLSNLSNNSNHSNYSSNLILPDPLTIEVPLASVLSSSQDDSNIPKVETSNTEPAISPALSKNSSSTNLNYFSNSRGLSKILPSTSNSNSISPYTSSISIKNQTNDKDIDSSPV